MRKRKTLAEELISVTKKFRRMFLEQTVSDLGEVPAIPAGEGEEVNVSADEIGDEVYGDAVQEIVSAMNDAGIEGFEANGITTFVLKKDGKEITFEVSTIDSEPVVAIYTENGRITVSLAPLIGYVQSAEDAVEKLANDADALDEFSTLAGDVAGIDVGAESEVGSDWYGEEPGEEDEFEAGGEEVGDEGGFEVDDEEVDGEDEFGVDDNEPGDEDEEPGEDEEVEGGDEEEAEGSGGVRESIRRKMRALRLREQTDQYDMSSGRRDITIGMIQDSDQKIGGIPVKTADMAKGKEYVSGGEGKAVTTYPNLYALFREKEGLPDIEGFVREEVPSSESIK